MVLPRNSIPLVYAFLRSLNLSPPSTGILRLASCKKRTPVNKCANTNSATESDDEAGVLTTAKPLPLAYSTSILSIPTPPLPINFRLGQASIKSLRTLVAERTVIASYSFKREAS
ncbi:hypothetical protein D3C78_1611810 [compost metagenome]